jgi:hypothetical protein
MEGAWITTFAVPHVDYFQLVFPWNKEKAKELNK